MDTPPIRRRLQRWEHAGHLRFLTFSCYKRLPLLENDAIRELFLSRLDLVRRQQEVRVMAWVLMSEHVHLLVFPVGDPDLTKFTHALKRPFAERVLRRWKELKAPILARISCGSGHRYWQTGGGYDRNLYSTREVAEKVDYIHANPVLRELVKIPTDYPWSSARWYEGFEDAKFQCDLVS